MPQNSLNLVEASIFKNYGSLRHKSYKEISMIIVCLKSSKRKGLNRLIPIFDSKIAH